MSSMNIRKFLSAIDFLYEIDFPMTTDTTLESFHPSRRCQSAPSKHRNRYHQYLKKLQEKNKLLQTEDKSKDEHLKQRENGFQLYVNGAHSAPPRRPPSASRKKPANPSNGLQTPTPFFSNRRRQWSSNNQTKIKTEQGSIIADIDETPLPRNTHITYRLNVDQSWMPNWYSQMQSTDFPQNLSLSFDDIPTKTQQLTYRLSTVVGR